MPGGTSYVRRPMLGKRKRAVSGFKKSKKSRYEQFKTVNPPQGRAGLFKFSGEGPFPNKLATTLLYRSIPVAQSGSAGTGTYFLNVALNNLFDFDVSNVLGNKQPLFYDQLFSATGPYTRLECKSWRTRITVINTGAEPVTIYWNGKGSAITASEEDTLAEVTNRAYMQQYHLGAKGQAGDRCYIKSSGSWFQHNTDIAAIAQAYDASPATQVYGTLFANTPTNTTAPTVVIQIDHYFDIVCLRADSTVS